MGGRDRAGATLLALLVLAGCGSETAQDGDTTSTASAAPAAMTGGDVQVSCGGNPPGWPASIMAEGMPGVLTDAEARAIFQGILDDPKYAGEAELSLFRDGIGVDWRVLIDGDDSMVLGLGPWTERGPGAAGAYVLGLEREGDGWVPGGWGSCAMLAPVLEPGNSWVDVTAYEVAVSDPAELVVVLNEIDCTGSRDPIPYLHEPVVVETGKTVTLYWTSTPPEEDNTCPGNPSVRVSVNLEAPLGDRTVLDGFEYPPQPVPIG